MNNLKKKITKGRKQKLNKTILIYIYIPSYKYIPGPLFPLYYCFQKDVTKKVRYIMYYILLISLTRCFHVMPLLSHLNSLQLSFLFLPIYYWYIHMSSIPAQKKERKGSRIKLRVFQNLSAFEAIKV